MIPAMIDFLTTYHQQGDANGVLLVARSMLNAIPDDLVALQFMALALLWLGHKERALSLFRKAAAVAQRTPDPVESRTCERATSITMREAARPELAGGWRQISHVLELHGLDDLAQRARGMADHTRT